MSKESEQSCIRVSRVSEWVWQGRDNGKSVWQGREKDREEGRKEEREGARERGSERAMEWVSGRVGRESVREWAMVDLIVGASEHVITFVTDWKSMNDWSNKWIIIFL